MRFRHHNPATTPGSFTAPLTAGLLAIALTCPAHGQLLWSEEFNAGNVPDETTWSYDLGATGWGNQELQEYTDDPANVKVEDGHLVITVRPQDSGPPFTSGRVRTQDKVTFRYGTIEARIMMPDLAHGLWPAFWTLGNSFGQVGWPDSGELDIVEMGSAAARTAGVINRRVGSTAHWELNGNHVFTGRSLNAPSDLDGEFHVFRMDWTPAAVSTFLDGAPIWNIDITSGACADCEEFHEPHFMILNVAVGGTFTQLFNAAQITAPLPAEMRVDWIRIHDNGFTELGGSAIEANPPAVGAGHSGSFYNPDQSGHGFSIEVGELGGEPYAVVYWYAYDSLGNPMFMLGTGRPQDNVLEVQFESPWGMVFGVFDPNTVNRPDGGTGTFVFSDRDTATFSYTPSDFNVGDRGHVPVEALPLIKLFDVGAH